VSLNSHTFSSAGDIRLLASVVNLGGGFDTLASAQGRTL